jgi:protein PhnA
MANFDNEEEFDYDFDYEQDYKNPNKQSDDTSEKSLVCKDSNGNILAEGDSVTVIKDLKVRGSSMVIKRGTKVKSIRLTENIEELDAKVEGNWIVLRAEFLKKV